MFKFSNRFFLFFLSAVIYHIALGQASTFTIQGEVAEGSSGAPLGFVTVMAYKSADSTRLSGTTSLEDGTFSVNSKQQNVYLELSFMGYASQKVSVTTWENAIAQVGKVVLLPNNLALDGVTVRAEKSSVEFKLDKRVFNVGKDLSSTGASALDVLNNVPSVNVNIEGEISLRGSSGVQVLINGKPSVIASEQGNAMGTITADMIEKIEVITNPSAKYDAEGTAGIINIVLKKEERRGLNGSLSLNIGTPHNHSVGLSLNRRTEKFNLFSQLGAGYRSLPRYRENINRDLVSNTDIISEGIEYRNEFFYNIVLGTDYYINKYNVITLSGNFAYEIEEQPSETNFQKIDANGDLLSEWNRTEVTSALNPKWQYELNYKKDFKNKKDHNLLFTSIGRFFGKDQSSEFANVEILDFDGVSNQRTATKFNEASYSFNLDYTNPINDKITLEVGSQYVATDVGNDFSVSNLLNNEWIQNDGLTNVFEFDQNVLGVYTTGSYEYKRWGLKLGLRMENTQLNTLLINTNERNDQTYFNFFPTVHSSYKLTKAISMQLGYSRRIFRPRMWDLNPFFNIRNDFAVRQGNPNLLPEFTDSYELSTIFTGKKVSLNSSIYHKYTTEKIDRVSVFENNISITAPYNIGTNITNGLELNGKYTATKKLSFNGDFNYGIFVREGTFEQTDFDFTANIWSSKLTAKVKLPYDFDFETTGQFRSKEQTVQGVRSSRLWGDLGLRKKIKDGKGVFSLSVRDIFASRIDENFTDQPDFYLYSRGFRGRFITFGFSYGFGKGEAMQYSGQRRR
jgi:outer membrane receptor protein involved in Fe transport